MNTNSINSNERLLDTIGEFLPSRKQDQHQPQFIKDGPTIVVVGPTGSGKTALLNLLIGKPILPEGTGLTTAAPIVIRNDSAATIRANDHNNKPVKGIPTIKNIKINKNEKLPCLEDDILCALKRTQNWELINKLKKTFWAPAFKSARKGICQYIDVRLPLPWLPENVKILDMPGYEGWQPNGRTQLHERTSSWLKDADNLLIVMEKSKILLSGAYKHIKSSEARGSISVLINQMDTFNPLQVKGIKREEQAFPIFKKNLLTRLKKENFPVESVPIHFGAARIGNRIQPMLKNQLAAEMSAWFEDFSGMLDVINKKREGNYRPGKPLKRQKQKKFKEYLRSMVVESIDTAYDQAQRIFLSESKIKCVKQHIGSAINNMDIAYADLFKKRELAEKYNFQIIEKITPAVKNNFEDALRNYCNCLQHQVQNSLDDFAKKVSWNSASINQSGLSILLGQSSGSINDQVYGSLATLLGGVITSIVFSLVMVETTKILFIVISTTVNPVFLTTAIVGALAAAIGAKSFFSLKKRVNRKVSDAVLPIFNRDMMSDIWNKSTKELNSRVFEAIWNGRDKNGAPLFLNGNRFDGLEALIE